MQLVRVVASHFVAGFETDGIVRRCAPILDPKRRPQDSILGKTDADARAIIARHGWIASVITSQSSR